MKRCDFYSDTPPDILELWLESVRRTPPAEKIARVFEMNEMSRKLAEAEMRWRHPEANAREIFLRVAAKHLDRETMIRAYGWDPAANG